MTESKDSDEQGTTQVITTGAIRRRLSKASDNPAALVLLVGPATQMGKQWDLQETELFIGRDEDCQIVVHDRSISGRHARVFRDNDDLYLQDLQSTNGAMINQQRLQAGQHALLQDNDQIILGNIVFKFLAQGNLEALQNKMIYRRAAIDPLTQIFNRRGLEEHGAEAVKSARAADLPVTAVVFDIDDFKRINDTHGHQCGDYVLQELAAVVSQHVIREGDLFARYGGEEFCLLLTATDLEQATIIGERIRATVAEHHFCYGDWVLNVTVSVGVASAGAEISDWQALFELADRATYVSKRHGKNRVTTAASAAELDAYAEPGADTLE